jgi:hypothetical protein
MLLMLFCALPFAAHAQNNDGKLTMTFKNEPLANVLVRLENSSSYRFLFIYEDVTPYKVNGKVTNAAFFDVVKYVLRDTPLEYSVDGKFVNINPKNKKTNPQN